MQPDRAEGSESRSGVLTEAFLEQHEAAPSTLVWPLEKMGPALDRFGDERIGSLRVSNIAAWRASLPEGKRFQ